MALGLPTSVQDKNLLYYTLVIVVLGTPLWWHTTDTYRAALPSRQIRDLQEYKMLLNIPVGVCFSAEEAPEQRVRQVITALKPLVLAKIPKGGRVIYDVDIQLRGACGELPYTVQLTNSVVRPSKAEASPEGYLKVSFEKIDRKISDVAGDMVRYLDLDHIRNHVQSVDSPELHSTNQDVRNAMAVATSYNVLVSVVNPDPAAISIDYNLAQGTRYYLEPFLAGLSDIANITYQTQVIRYVNLPILPVKDGDQYYLQEENLPHLINPIESKLGTSTSNDINLIIYLIEEKYCPLRIRTAQGELTDMLSFLSPQFGAVLLYETAGKSEIDHSVAFSVLLPQLKQLLGLKPSGSPGVSAEERYVMRARTALTHSLKSIDTLNSLISLTDSIPNMVIGDHIADQVEASIADIHAAHTALASGDMTSALVFASRARDNAEKSFSDPSILALLYFPDDQKFAIYIPLFLPVGLPLLVAYLELIKKRKQKQKSE